jgi:hypothetical protein
MPPAMMRSLRLMKLEGPLTMPNEPRRLISTSTLHSLISDLNGLPASIEKQSATMPTPLSSLSESHADVALIVGGGGDPLSEYSAARAMCDAASKSVSTFVCNDTLTIFPDAIDYAVTLHPDKMHGWQRERTKNKLPMPFGSIWCHRSYLGFSHHTRDWQGSSGLFMVKIALEQGFTHMILCGIPMDVDSDHIMRHKPWNAAPGFVRGWNRHMMEIKPFVRSLSGWTRQQLGEPDMLWLALNIPRGAPVPR